MLYQIANVLFDGISVDDPMFNSYVAAFLIYGLIALSLVLFGILLFRVVDYLIYKFSHNYRLDSAIYRHILLSNGFKPEVIDNVVKDPDVRRNITHASDWY